jgi:hypothetical protein
MQKNPKISSTKKKKNTIRKTQKHRWFMSYNNKHKQQKTQKKQLQQHG